MADSAGLYPLIEDLTSDFACARLHGSTRLYVSGYSRRDLEPWAQRVQARHAGLDAPGATLIGPARKSRERKPLEVFVYFDNDVKVRAPFDAQNLARLLAGQPALKLPASLRAVTEEPRRGWRAG